MFPETFTTIPSDREGASRLVGVVVLVSSGSGYMAEAAATATYVKLGEVAVAKDEIISRLSTDISKKIR